MAIHLGKRTDSQPNFKSHFYNLDTRILFLEFKNSLKNIKETFWRNFIYGKKNGFYNQQKKSILSLFRAHNTFKKKTE